MSPEIAVMLQPSAAYRRMAQEYPALRAARALRRPAIVALVAGGAISIGATGRATAPLVLSTTLCWSFALAWQLLAAAAVAGAPRTRLTFPQRLDLFFVGHAPWSLWLLGAAAWSRLFPDNTDFYFLLHTVAVPAAWTFLIVYGFGRGVLELTRRRALFRAALHQAIVWLFAFTYVAWAVALWPRIIAAAP